LINAINNLVSLGRAISKKGVFKGCMFDARKTLHIERENSRKKFVAKDGVQISFEISDANSSEAGSSGNTDKKTRLHSYFEDGSDPDEMLQLPESIMKILVTMNQIHHTGCIIFEAVEKDLKIHNYLTLLDKSREQEFGNCLTQILTKVNEIDGLGVSGFMKLPYKNTKFFSYLEKQPQQFCCAEKP
jgi:non-specific serine/threonine protein kinase